MASYYANLTVRCNNPAAVAMVLRDRKAIVTPAQNGCVVAIDEAAEALGREPMQALACLVSSRLFCSVLAVGNDDESTLWYTLATDGLVVDEYDSAAEPAAPVTLSQHTASTHAARLCAAFGAPDPLRVEAILRKKMAGHAAYVFESERHTALTKALNIPAFAVGFGFARVTELDFPNAIAANELIYIS